MFLLYQKKQFTAKAQKALKHRRDGTRKRFSPRRNEEHEEKKQDLPVFLLLSSCSSFLRGENLFLEICRFLPSKQLFISLRPQNAERLFNHHVPARQRADRHHQRR